MLCCSLTSDKRVPLFVRSGAEIIQDRLVFAASNYKPLKQLRDAWAAAASDWLMKYESLKRAYDSEVEKLRVAEARAAASSGAKRGRGTGEEPPAKRMRVRSAQVAKEKYRGSLTVSPGDLCTPSSSPVSIRFGHASRWTTMVGWASSRRAGWCGRARRAGAARPK